MFDTSSYLKYDFYSAYCPDYIATVYKPSIQNSWFNFITDSYPGWCLYLACGTYVVLWILGEQTFS